MYLAVKLSKFEVKDWANRLPNHHNWWDQFVEDLDTSDLEEICHQVLDLYTQPVTATKEAALTPPPGAAPKGKLSKFFDEIIFTEFLLLFTKCARKFKKVQAKKTHERK